MNPLVLENAVVIGEELALAWSDGHESYLKLEALRKACPCAACQGEPDVTGKVSIPKVTHDPSRSFTLRKHEVVGGYAIQLFWADGHSSGIFSYHLLRSL
ncbi:MAG: DUF971 domain-containing protein [Akkermansiaceae bacterium]